MKPQTRKVNSFSGITPRAILLGILLTPVNAYWLAQMTWVRYHGQPLGLNIFFNCVFILLCLVLLNAGLRRVAPRWCLEPRELLVIYIMLNIANAVMPRIGILSPAMSLWARYATPANKWEELFFRYIPQWLYFGDDNIIRGLYEGGDTLYRVQYLVAWVPRILSWSAFIVVQVFMMLCLTALFRRRWTEHEKLNYPLTHLPLELTQPDCPLLRNKIMWAGFAVVGAIDLLNGFHQFWPALPMIPIRVIDFGGPSTWNVFPFGFYPFAIGLGMLMPADLLFSCWFFWLAWQLQTVIGGVLGWSGIPRFPFVSEQGSGAYLALGAFALWASRKHLAQIASGLLRGDKRLGDEDEPMGYRFAAYGLLAGAVFLLFFFGKMGMSWWIVVPFFALDFLIAIFVARVRAELGPPVHDLAYGGPDQIIIRSLGTRPSLLGARNITVLGLMWGLRRQYHAHPMPFQLEGYKMAQTTGIGYRRLSAVLMVAAVVGTLAAFWGLYHCYYIYGMDAEMDSVSRRVGIEPFQHLQSWFESPQGTDWYAVVAMVASVGFTLLLMLLRMRFAWWPFHPVGYALASTPGSNMNLLWLPLLIAWVAKVLILRYRGHKLFLAVIPFALGLILGEFIIGSLWTIIGIAFGVPTYAFWPY